MGTQKEIAEFVPAAIKTAASAMMESNAIGITLIAKATHELVACLRSIRVNGTDREKQYAAEVLKGLVEVINGD